MTANRFTGTPSYIATHDLMMAVNAAVTLERPILIKGEPGTGKTQLAQEVASALDRPLFEWHIKSTTRAQQGLYDYDAVARLRDSQLGDDRVHDIANYIVRGKLWEAFESDVQPVLLIDEIDKADIEFPNDLLRELDALLALGARSVLLFGVVPDSVKSHAGEAAHDPSGPVARALRAARKEFGDDLVLLTDVCLCGYTDHGHCGLPRPGTAGVVIDNDATLPHLAAMALAHAEAGADMVAPSDMMDGRVGWVRRALDDGGYSAVGILSYAVKYASAFYGPFREAAGSTPGTGDRRSYQMDPRNRREARLEARQDEAEAADMLMVKPALAYLDVIADVRAASDLPLVAYSVSGEYAMIKAGAAGGALDEEQAVRETLLSMRRAGADMVISYYTGEALRKGWLA